MSSVWLSVALPPRWPAVPGCLTAVSFLRAANVESSPPTATASRTPRWVTIAMSPCNLLPPHQYPSPALIVLKLSASLVTSQLPLKHISSQQTNGIRGAKVRQHTSPSHVFCLKTPSHQRWRWSLRSTCMDTQQRSPACLCANPTASSSAWAKMAPVSSGTSTGMWYKKKKILSLWNEADGFAAAHSPQAVLRSEPHGTQKSGNSCVCQRDHWRHRNSLRLRWTLICPLF